MESVVADRVPKRRDWRRKCHDTGGRRRSPPQKEEEREKPLSFVVYPQRVLFSLLWLLARSSDNGMKSENQGKTKEFDAERKELKFLRTTGKVELPKFLANWFLLEIS